MPSQPNTGPIPYEKWGHGCSFIIINNILLNRSLKRQLAIELIIVIEERKNQYIREIN